MSRHPRIRRISKWTGLVVFVLIVVAWGLSLRWFVRHEQNGLAAGCAHGTVTVVTGSWVGDGGTKVARLTPQTIQTVFDAILATYHANSGFHWPRVTKAGVSHGVPPTFLFIPLWLPLVVVAIPTSILFYRDHKRIPPGHCQECGYNLTGNESGICPECGTEIRKRA